jgi:hypothetical protein
MKRASMCVLALVCVSLAGCQGENTPKVVGSGVSKTELRTVPAFTKVDFHGYGTLEVTAGSLEPVSVTADDNILPILTTVVAGDTLTIRPSEERVEYKTKPVVRATSPGIDAVHCMGSGDITVSAIDAPAVEFSVMGAGRLKAVGKTDDLKITIQGAGSIETSGLEAAKVTVRIDGTGSADVHAVTNLNVTINGAASVRYSGDPVVEKQIAGIGTIEKK